jgi:hypothetical protein
MPAAVDTGLRGGGRGEEAAAVELQGILAKENTEQPRDTVQHTSTNAEYKTKRGLCFKGSSSTAIHLNHRFK